MEIVGWTLVISCGILVMAAMSVGLRRILTRADGGKPSSNRVLIIVMGGGGLLGLTGIGLVLLAWLTP